MNNKIKSHDISKLPRYILLEILYYIPWQEIIVSISHTNQELFKIFHDPTFIRYYLNKVIIFNNYRLNLKIVDMNVRQILKFLLQNSQQKIEELPFWGYRTDSGIYQNIFNYWIEKSFTQSQNQMVSYKKYNNVHIEGALAHDITEFKQVMIQMSDKLNNYYKYYNLKKQAFPIQYSQINIDKIFYEYYESSQLSTYLEESGKSYWNHFLKYDAQLEQAIDYNEMIIEQAYVKIKYTQGLIYSMKISRKGSFTRPVKTLMIFYKDEESKKCEGMIKIFDNCNSYGQLKVVLYQGKNVMPKIKKDKVEGGMHYVLFERNEIGVLDFYYPLMWVQFQDDQVKEFSFRFNLTQRFLANKIIIKIIDHSSHDIDLCGDGYDQTFQEPLNGPGFSYVSFQGVQLNTKNLFQKPVKKKRQLFKIRPKSRQRNKTIIN